MNARHFTGTPSQDNRRSSTALVESARGPATISSRNDGGVSRTRFSAAAKNAKTSVRALASYNTTAGNAVILQAATPVIVVLIARFYLGERLLRIQWLGVVASVLGVLLVITRGPFAMLEPADLHSGDFITLVSLGCWAVYTVYGKRVLASYSPLLATTAAYMMGTLMILPTAALTAPLFPAPRLASLTAWSIVFYQGILGAVAHIWWYEAVLVVGPSQAAIFTNLQPIVGIVLAPLLLGERIGVWHVVGTLFVLAGVGLTTRVYATKPAEQEHAS